MKEKEIKFFKKVEFAWVMLIFLPPIGIYLMFKYRHHSTVVRIVVSLIFGILFLYTITSDDDNDAMNEEKNDFNTEIVVENDDEEAEKLRAEFKKTNA